MAGKHGKRLAKVEYSLTPKQAVVLWLEEALQHGSLQAYAHWLKEQPASAYPLFRLPGQVRQAVKDAMKGQPREAIERAVELAELCGSFSRYPMPNPRSGGPVYVA